MPRYAALCRAMLLHMLVYHIMLDCIMLAYAISCHIMLHRNTLLPRAARRAASPDTTRPTRELRIWIVLFKSYIIMIISVTIIIIITSLLLIIIITITIIVITINYYVSWFVEFHAEDVMCERVRKRCYVSSMRKM